MLEKRLPLRNKIRFSKNLYCGEKAEDQKRKIIWRLKHSAGMVKAYVITFPSNPGNLLDIYHNAQLLQPYYKKKELFVVGIAWGYEEALQVVEMIIKEVYENTGGFHVKAYLQSKEES